MMEEARKDKLIRFTLIFLSMLIVCISLFYKNISYEEEKKSPIVQVMVLGDNQKDPVVAVARQINKENVLILYRIVMDDNYKFDTLIAKKLDFYPTEMVALVDNSGLGVQHNGSWYCYDKQLKQRENIEKIKIMENPYSFSSIKTDDKLYQTTVKRKDQILWQHNFTEKLSSAYPLTKEEDLWVIVFESGIQVYKK